MSRIRRLLPAVLAVALVAVVQPLMSAPAGAATVSASTEPAPDPGFSKFGSSYYIYATSGSNGVLPILRGSSLTTSNSFTKVGNAYSSAPSGFTGIWAPHVISRGGQYFMFFTASQSGANHCLYWAVSSSPTGGFSAPHKLLTSCDSTWENIDPTIYHSAAGDDYVVWKKGRYTTGFPHGDFYINAQKLTISGTSVALAGTAAFTLAKVLDGTCMEAPTVFSHGDKVWLFVSRDRFDTNAYYTQAWSASDFFHPFSPVNTVMKYGQGYGAGPGGAETINESGTIRIAYHVWDRDKPTPSSPGIRVSRVGTVLWHTNGEPYVG